MASVLPLPAAVSGCAAVPVPEELPAVETLQAENADVARQLWMMGDDHFSATAGFTGSMRPYIEGGEILLVEKYREQQIRKHMLLIFSRWDKPHGVLHECVDVDGEFFRAKGLHCMDADGWYPQDRIKSIVRRVLRVDNSSIKAAGVPAANTKKGELR